MAPAGAERRTRRAGAPLSGAGCAEVRRCGGRRRPGAFRGEVARLRFSIMLELEYCRRRARRLLERVCARQLDAAVLGLGHHVYWLTGHRPFWLHECAAVLFCDGHTWLTTANRPAERAAADEAVSFEASRMGTQRQEQPAVAAAQVLEALRARKARRIGCDASAVGSQLLMCGWEGHCQSIDAELWQLRRRKDPDELALMERAVACTEAMYATAREMIAPGVPELEVYAALHAAAVRAAGEPLTALLGNDFACGAGGGPPRAGRRAAAGELYIIDLGPAVRGYFADNCRTFCVGGRPTDAQAKAWEAVAGCHEIVQRMARPGARCREIFAAVDEHLKRTRGTGMPHHLGHGVGLQPHEYPHLNPAWDDVLMEGEVFTAEPGQYGADLAAGIRIENQYVVTAEGVRNMCAFPMGLV